MAPMTAFDQIVFQRDRLLCEVEDLLDLAVSAGAGPEALAVLERHREQERRWLAHRAVPKRKETP